MKKKKVYYIPLKSFEKVPEYIEKISKDFFGKNRFVAIKIHFGEKGNKYFLDPKFSVPIVKAAKKKGALPYLTDTNTIYHGSRSNSVKHFLVAHGHGYKTEKLEAPVIISGGLRGNDYDEVKIDGRHFKIVKIARGISDADSMVVVSHVKGHILTGFGGAIKNIGMGCSSRSAKYEMHNAAYPVMDIDKCIGCGLCIEKCAGDALTLKGDRISLDKDKCVGCGECIVACHQHVFDVPWDIPSKKVQERIVEYALGTVKDKPVCYVNFLCAVTRHCDCMPSDDEPPFLEDVGILISDDPVAVDQAGVDLINKAAGKDLFRELHPKVDYNIQLSYAEKMKLGSRAYELIKD